jgi:hypothetical protein
MSFCVGKEAIRPRVILLYLLAADGVGVTA